MSSCSPVSARDQKAHDYINAIRPIAAAISLRRLPEEAVSECGSRAVRCAWKVQRAETEMYLFIVVIVVVANLNCKCLILWCRPQAREGGKVSRAACGRPQQREGRSHRCLSSATFMVTAMARKSEKSIHADGYLRLHDARALRPDVCFEHAGAPPLVWEDMPRGCRPSMR